MKLLAFALIESPRVSERLHPSARQSSDTEASRCAIAAWASCTWAFDSANFLPPSRPRTVVHSIVQNLFRVGRHLLRAAHHRLLRTRAFAEWDAVTCAC